MIVFWSYRLEPIDAPARERLGGFVLFPRVDADRRHGRTGGNNDGDPGQSTTIHEE